MNTTENSKINVDENQKSSTKNSVIFSLIYLLTSLGAAYLSWKCNVKYNYSLSSKILFWIIAFIFGPLYLIYYVVVKYDMCHKIDIDKVLK